MRQEKEKKGRRWSGWLLLLLIPAVYLGIQIYGSQNRPYRTQTAVEVTLTDETEVSGAAVRRETVVPFDGGTVGYEADDAQRVSAGAAVASLYDSAQQLQSHEQAKQIARQITLLQNALSAGTGVGTDLETVLKQMDDELYALVRQESTNDYSRLADIRGQMTYDSNKLQVALGKANNFDDLIAALQTQQASCEAAGQASGTIQAPVTGYFCHDTDGLEDLTPESCQAWDAPTLESFLGTASTAAVPNALGRMVTDYKWYYYALFSGSDYGRFFVGQEVTLHFSDYGVRDVPAEVEEIRGNEGDDKLVAVFRIEQFDADVCSLRLETADVEFATYTGLRIPRSALHINDKGETGIYVKFGSLVYFRKISPIFENDSYLLVPSVPSEDGTNEVEPFDEIIIEGKDLYDGKLL